ncbi:MAG: molybdopterin synthase catalytic subunit MoaE [Gammaproteobacteria bacterium]
MSESGDISVQQQAFDLAAEYVALRERAGDAGAIVTFTGLVREIYNPQVQDGVAEESPIQSLFLEHYPGMTEKCLQDILEQAAGKWPLLAARIIHRVGKLNPGEEIVFVGTASAHRQAAFDAAQFMMDYLKSNAPFWKKQSTADGTHWVDSRQSDADAIKRWQ